jgi:hypothetical protein
MSHPFLYGNFFSYFASKKLTTNHVTAIRAGHNRYCSISVIYIFSCYYAIVLSCNRAIVQSPTLPFFPGSLLNPPQPLPGGDLVYFSHSPLLPFPPFFPGSFIFCLLSFIFYLNIHALPPPSTLPR